MNQRVQDFLLGVTTITLLWAAVSYSNPAYRCIGERGTVWVGPVARCFAASDVFPASAFTPAR